MQRQKANPDRLEGMQTLTLELARMLSNGDMLYHATATNADGTAMRHKITSLKTWKRDVSRIELGYKHGMYETGKLNQYDLVDFRVEQHTYDRLVMLSQGWIAWGYQHAVSASGFTWAYGWYNPTKQITKIGRVKVYGMPVLFCGTCGKDRSEQVDQYNPYPKLCATCGSWY